MKFADSLYSQGAYRWAAVEYERMVYLSEQPGLQFTAILKKVDCLKQLRLYADARNILDRIPKSGLSDSSLYKIYDQSALCSYLAGNYEDAESQFAEMDHFVKARGLKDRTYFLRTLNYNELGQYEKAKETLKAYLSTLQLSPQVSDSIMAEADRLYKPGRLPAKKKHDKAMLLSTVMPGAGQAYCGYPFDGLLNLSLNLAVAAAGIYGVLNAYYFTGYLLGTGFLQKTYFGGLRRTEYLVAKSNYHSSRTFNDKARNFLFGISDRFGK